MADAPGGRTTIDPRVADRLARHAARAASVAVAGHVGRGGLPRVDVSLAGSRARLTVEIASRWPEPAAQAAARVRDDVCAELSRWAGVAVDDIAVRVVDVASPAAPSRRRLQ